MKNFKNIIFAISIILIFIFIFTSCGATDNDIEEDDGRLKIVATLFPQYDFARQIAGDKANVKLLLPPGVESHSFDPKPGDMLKIYNADLFIYTGENMEPWAEVILKGATNDNLTVVDCSKNIELLQDDSDHEHNADPHIWLDPTRAIQMIENILDALCAKDPENADFYTQNAEDYIKLLQKFDEDAFDVINNAKRNVIVFGGRFSYIYFLTHFGLDYVTAYDSCAATEEPSVAKVLSIVKFIHENNIPCIYHEELSAHQIAKAIAKESGRKTYLFSTAHNVTKSEFDNGITFLDIMYANLENLKIGLN
jgi:zinc transport system substrate-binding protein